MACTEWECLSCGELFFSNSKVCPKCGNTNVSLIAYDDIIHEMRDDDFECEVDDEEEL
jgi:rRNA maturation endonuclease Nob1